MAQTIFERCGGFANVRKIVSAFYDKVLESEKIKHHFASADMRTLLDHQTKFVTTVMGGPASFTDEALRRAHAPLGITPAEFLEVVRLLQEALEEGGLDQADVTHVVAQIAKRESFIVSRPD